MRAAVLSLLICVMIALFAGHGATLPQDGLVLHYTFEPAHITGESVADRSGQSTDGVINGDAEITDTGLMFDGVDDYVGGEPIDIRTAEVEFTAFGWIQTTEASNGPLWMWGDNAMPSASGSAEAPVGWRSSSGNFAAGFYQGGHFYADAATDYADGEWHCVVQMGTADTGYLYVDGVEIGSATAGYVYGASPYFLIGARTKNSGSEVDDVEYFQGQIWQIALYNVALDADEIKAISEETQPVESYDKLTTLWGQLKR